MASEGTDLFGKLDYIPQLGFVATRFWHLNGVPLIPLGSYFVLEEWTEFTTVIFEQRGGFRGIPLGFDIRSVALGYLEAAAKVGAMAGCVLTGVMFAGNLQTAHLMGPLIASAVLLVISVALLLSLHYWSSLRVAGETRKEMWMARLTSPPSDGRRLLDNRKSRAPSPAPSTRSPEATSPTSFVENRCPHCRMILTRTERSASDCLVCHKPLQNLDRDRH